MATTFQDVIDLTTAEDTTIDSVIALLGGVQQQVADLLSGAQVSPATQAGVDAIFAKVTGSKSKLDAALAANVPPTP